MDDEECLYSGSENTWLSFVPVTFCTIELILYDCTISIIKLNEMENDFKRCQNEEIPVLDFSRL